MGGDYEKGLFRQLQEVMERCDKLDNEITENKVRHKATVEKLEDRIKKLEEENTLLRNDNERMRRILNNDSSNSSMPPSADQKGKSANTYNGRIKSGKKCGGQIGHKGATLTKGDVQDKIKSGAYQHKVVTVGKPEGNYVSKYVVDLEIRPVATEYRFYPNKDGRITIPQEYRSDVTYGIVIKSIAVDLYSEGAVSNDRICDFINAISGSRLQLSTGSIYGFCRGFFDRCTGSIEQIKTELLNSATVYTDATVVTVNGNQAYIRNQSTEKAVLYSPMEKKNIDALNETGILSSYSGSLVHDHETALYRYGSAHGECIVHLMRYLKKNNEESGNIWSGELITLFSMTNAERKKRVIDGSAFRSDEIEYYESEYDRIVQKGREENGNTKGKYARQEEKKLLNRLEKYKANHLLFLHDFDVGFNNNISERDLRKCKTKQKVTGGFRKQSGNEIYCNIMSIIETCKRNKKFVFESIRQIFDGTSAIF